MDFALDEDQRAVADLAAGVLRRETPGAEARPDGGTGWKAAWQGLAQAGLLGIALPESLDGAGRGVLETGLILTEVGRVAADLPALATLTLGVLPIATFGTPDQQNQLLPAVAAGDRVLTAALAEPGAPLPALPGTVARPAGDGTFTVSGRKTGVGYAAESHRVLVPVRLTGEDTGVLLVDPTAPGVRCVPTPAAGGAPEYTLVLDEVRVAEPDLLGGDRTGAALAGLHAFAVTGACAVGDGLLAGALDLTTAHLRTRHQFGRPLATFQAVAQQIADVYIAARTLHLLARSTQWRLATGRDAAADLDVAAYWLAEELPAALYTCHHLHGGIGVDIGYPMHRYSSAGRDLARFLGGAEDRLTRLGARCSSN